MLHFKTCDYDEDLALDGGLLPIYDVPNGKPLQFKPPSA